MDCCAPECRVAEKSPPAGDHQEWSSSAASGCGRGPSCGIGSDGDGSGVAFMMTVVKTVLITIGLAVCVACNSSTAAPPATVSAAEAAPVSEHASVVTASSKEAEFLASGPIVVENQV